MPRVSVIVVNYNGRALLADCLQSLREQTLSREEFEVVVVDNASTDRSADLVRSDFPWVRLIELRHNAGFAAGNNVGIRATHGDFVALLNNDAIAERGWLRSLLDGAERFPSIGGVASKILFRHSSNELNSAGLILYRDGRGGDRGFRQLDRGQFDREEEVFGGCGAAVLLRRQMLDDIGGFDERLFMYYEDLDLAWRARLRGWSFMYQPKAVARHAHCATSGEWSPFFSFHVERNRVLVNLKNQKPLRAAVVAIGLPARVARTWWRAAIGRRPWTMRHGVAYVRAAVSVLRHLPGVLFDRCRNRMGRRKVGDAAWSRLIAVGPKSLESSCA